MHYGLGFRVWVYGLGFTGMQQGQSLDDLGPWQVRLHYMSAIVPLHSDLIELIEIFMEILYFMHCSAIP